MRQLVIGRCVRLFVAALAAAFVVGTTSEASAADGPEEGWWVRVSPYFWASGINGDVAVGDRSVEIDKGFSDIWENLDFAALGAVEVGQDDWSVLADVIYLDLSAQETLSGPAAAEVDANFQQWLVTGALTWRGLRGRWGTLGVLGGGRYVNLQTDLEIRLPEQTLTPSAEKDWVDPILGVRGRVYLVSQLFVPYYLDVGGFGVGSDFASQGFTGLGYGFPWIDVVLAYRYLYMDYKEDNFAYDATTHGLKLGVVLRF
jgi:hypothetical protein